MGKTFDGTSDAVDSTVCWAGNGRIIPGAESSVLLAGFDCDGVNLPVDSLAPTQAHGKGTCQQMARACRRMGIVDHAGGGMETVENKPCMVRVWDDVLVGSDSPTAGIQCLQNAAIEKDPTK